MLLYMEDIASYDSHQTILSTEIHGFRLYDQMQKGYLRP